VSIVAPSPLSGWLPEEVEVLTHVQQVLDHQLLYIRHGSRARRVAEAEREQTLASAGLDEDLFQAWSAGGVHPGRGIAVALAVDEQLVALPPGYDDTRDRGRLVAKLADRITGDPQVQTIVQSPDHTRCAAIVGTRSWRPRGEARAIPDGVRDAGAVDARLREGGQCLLAFDPPAHRMLVGNLAPFELGLRDRLAGVLKRAPWEIRLSTRWAVDPDTGAGVLVEVILPNAPVLAEDSGKARERWTAIAQGTVGGHSGWRAELDGLTQTVTLTAGAALDLPELADPMWALMDSLPRETMAFATDGFGRPVTIDLATNGGSLVAGKQGSGKFVLLQILLYNALISELDIAIVDPVKGGSDFAVFESFVRPGGWGCESYDEALAVVEGVYAEGLRRKALHKKYGVGKWSELPAEVIAAENIRPIFLVVYEATSLVQQDFVPKSLSHTDPRRTAIEEQNGTKELIVSELAKIARELRAVGVRPVLGTQRYEANAFGGGGLRANLGNRILMGRANAASIQMAVEDPGDMAEAYTMAHGQQASTGSDAGLGIGRAGRGVAEIDGRGHIPLQAWYASQNDLAAALRERGVVPQRGGRPAGAADADRDEVPELTPVAQPPAVVEIGEMSFELEDEEPQGAPAPPADDDDGWTD